jgi:hypothetical protein
MPITDSQLQVWGANTPQGWLKGEDLAQVMGLGVCAWLGWAA